MNQGIIQRMMHRFQKLRNRKGQPNDHRTHCQIEKRNTKGCSNDKFSPKNTNLFLFAKFILVYFCLPFTVRGLIPCFFYHTPYLRHIYFLRIIRYGCFFRCKIDGDSQHPFAFTKNFLNSICACGTCHPCNRYNDVTFMPLFQNVVPYFHECILNFRHRNHAIIKPYC